MDVLFMVLDVVVRIIGSAVLLGGLALLVLLLWDLTQPVDPYPEPTYEPHPMVGGMGFDAVFDYAQTGESFKDRLGQCYVLAAKALTSPNTNPDVPLPSAMIHGSWHGPEAPARIDHAVVLLSDGRIWEPVTAGIYDRAKFENYTRWERHQIYTATEARRLMLNTGHFGPWD